MLLGNYSRRKCDFNKKKRNKTLSVLAIDFSSSKDAAIVTPQRKTAHGDLSRRPTPYTITHAVSYPEIHLWSKGGRVSKESQITTLASQEP